MGEATGRNSVDDLKGESDFIASRPIDYAAYERAARGPWMKAFVRLLAAMSRKEKKEAK